MTATVDDWVIDGKLWRAGFYVNVETNALSRATGKWAVLGRTFYLSRDKGKTTKLNLKRQGDWAQPQLLKAYIIIKSIYRNSYLSQQQMSHFFIFMLMSLVVHVWVVLKLQVQF